MRDVSPILSSMDVAERRPTSYRVPVSAPLVPVVPLVVAAFWHPWLVGAVLGMLVQLVRCIRPALTLTDEAAVVHNSRWVEVPWESVTGIRRNRLVGGIVLETRSFAEVRVQVPCSWWGGPGPAEQVAEIERWWVDHRGPSWTPRGPFVPRPAPARPPVRYRASEVAGPMAVIGLVVAVVNGAALWWPAEGFSVGFLEVMKPSTDHTGWLIVAATAAGALLGVGWTWKAQRHLAGNPTPAAANTQPGEAARPLLVIAGVGTMAAIPQWLGLAPGIGSLTMLAAGVAVLIAAGTLAVTAHRFEQRTGRLLLCANPLARGLGLEAGPPV